MRSTRSRFLVGAAVMVALGAATPALCGWWAQAHGAELYDGRRPLAARMAGHDQTLPSAAARCSNCHEGAQAIGPPLNAATLAQPMARRGGPPSRYDATALCRLLREGIDPAFVTLARAMPRYDIGAADCAALWAHLASR